MMMVVVVMMMMMRCLLWLRFRAKPRHLPIYHTFADVCIYIYIQYSYPLSRSAPFMYTYIITYIYIYVQLYNHTYYTIHMIYILLLYNGICTHTPCGQFLLGALDRLPFCPGKVVLYLPGSEPIHGWDFNGSQRMGFRANFIHII